MPTKLLNESTMSGLETADDLLTPEGELTLQAEAVSDFLTHADFSAVFDLPAVQGKISTFDEGKITFGKDVDQDAVREAVAELTQDDDLPEGEALQVLSIADVLEHIDEDDLDTMFLHYASTLPNESLSDKARLAAIANATGVGLEEFARGAFRKIRRKPGGAALVARMLGAMVQKGQISRATKGKGYKGGDYERTAQYKSGPKKANLAKVARFKKANQAKLKKTARAARKAKKNKNEGFEGIEPMLFGLAVPFEGAMFEIAVNERASETAPAAAVKVSESRDTKLPGGGLTEGARLAANMSKLGAKA